MASFGRWANPRLGSRVCQAAHAAVIFLAAARDLAARDLQQPGPATCLAF